MEGIYFPLEKVGSHPMIVLFSLLVIAVSGVSLEKNQIDWLTVSLDNYFKPSSVVGVDFWGL